jgi:hypothetical protein
MTWSSLFLECTGFVLVWLPSRRLRHLTVASMILLHVGIDMTMNMHIFEWLSIIGWCMFLFESEEPSTEPWQREETNPPTAPLPKNRPTGPPPFHGRRGILDAFLITVLLIFFIDTVPFMELYDSLLLLLTYNAKTNEVLSSNASISLAKRALNLLYYSHWWRDQLFTIPIAIPFLYPLGLYQGVWNLYSGAPDTFCRYEILLSTNNNTFDAETLDRITSKDISIFRSPDWGTLTWWEKKRWQRPMTMYEKLPEYMCLDCFVQYHARQYMQQHGRGYIASLRLHVECERPPPPPAVDDWWNWTGWFYANAKQENLVPLDMESLLYVVNICDELSDDCVQWKLDGLCDWYNDNSSITDQDLFTMTQLCRRSCELCPEQGYDADKLLNGTRLSVIWPIPEKKMYVNDVHIASPEAMYYDATIIQVKDRPRGKRYLLRYDDAFYNSEWFDPILLRERGYRLISTPPPSELGLDSSLQDDAKLFQDEL